MVEYRAELKKLAVKVMEIMGFLCGLFTPWPEGVASHFPFISLNIIL
jgi:hypothetical protein